VTDNTLLTLADVSKAYGDISALDKISVNLHAGQMLALLGHNGAGKTTLMKIILGLVSVDSGSISVMGQAPGLLNQSIGYVPENVNFYPAMTGYETLTYFARLNGLNRIDAKSIATRLLDSVRLDGARHRPVKQYSKGMKQRLGLAQALLPSTNDGTTYFDPKLLILDEPTVGLDPVATSEFYEMLAQLRLDGCGIIICTHVLPGLEQYIDHALILNRGEVVASGPITSLYEQADLPLTVTPKGLNGSLNEDPLLQPYLQQNGLLKVPASDKMIVLEQLMKKPELEDIFLSTPTLPELYQYYVNRCEENTHGE